MEIASAAWAQWAGGRGRCLKEMGNPVRGEVTTTAVPLGCEPSGHGGCQSWCGSGRAFGKGRSAPDRLGCLGEQFVFLDSMLGASRRGTEAGEPPLELETGGFQHRPVGDKPERRARHGLSPVLRLRHDSCTGISRLIGSVNDQDLEDGITGQQQIHSGECPDRPSPICCALEPHPPPSAPPK